MPYPRQYLIAGGPPTQVTNWIWDPNTLATGDGGNPIATGVWRALQPSDMATTVDTLNISGINVNTDQLETINTSGTQYLAAISGNTAHGYSTVSSSTISGSMSSATTGIGLAANSNRKKLYAQVIGSGGPLFLNYNGVAASAQSFNVVLAAASSDPGTNGGVLSDLDFRGAVYVSGTVGARWVLWEGV